MRFGHEPPVPDVDAMVREAREDREEIKTLGARVAELEAALDAERQGFAEERAVWRETIAIHVRDRKEEREAHEKTRVAVSVVRSIRDERDEGRIALARIGALTHSLRCPACSKLHTDDGRTPEEQAWVQRPHRTHLCVDDAAGKGCGATWVQPVADVVAGVERLREEVARLRNERLRLIEELPDA